MKLKHLTTLAFIAAAALAVSPALRAATITVTNLNDSGPGSLRQAILEAAPGDTIVFGVTGTIGLTSGQLFIDKSLTIAGPGADKLAISGNKVSRVIQVQVRRGDPVTVHGVTIRDGANFDHFGGGGIFVDPFTTVTLARSAVLSSVAHSSSGGGIKNHGTLIVEGTLVADNAAATFGGGISSIPSIDAPSRTAVTIVNSTVSGNSADSGGGISSQMGLASITQSTFSGNSAATGGAILHDPTVIDSGRLFGHLNIKNSIVANSPSGGNCAFDDRGRGVRSFFPSGTNFSTDATCPGFTTATSGELNLGSLARNGGPTRTHGLLPGSVAIDAVGDCTDLGGNAVAADQRGIARPQDGDAGGMVLCDAGSYEAGLPFRAFKAKAEIEREDREFEMKAAFTLNFGSDGIDPAAEDVSFSLGSYSATIPAGSFKPHAARRGEDEDRGGSRARWTFKGVIDGVKLEAKIAERGRDKYELNVEGKGTHSIGAARPLPVGVTIGNDEGHAAIKAEFD